MPLSFLLTSATVVLLMAACYQLGQVVGGRHSRRGAQAGSLMPRPDPTDEEIASALASMAQTFDEGAPGSLPVLADQWADAFAYAAQLARAAHRIAQRGFAQRQAGRPNPTDANGFVNGFVEQLRDDVTALAHLTIRRLDALAERTARR